MHMECILKQIRINFGRARKMSSLFKKSTNNALQLCDKKLSAFPLGILEVQL